ncbi:hypothetical protein ABZX90_30660 [Streptomyces sp. NPDC002935]|uniref:hypothetical protein n=1 Tax=Streptomyces sp. NPDC002935 TaxID=3154545 RepID=UPI0033AC6CA0
MAARLPGHEVADLLRELVRTIHPADAELWRTGADLGRWAGRRGGRLPALGGACLSRPAPLRPGRHRAGTGRRCSPGRGGRVVVGRARRWPAACRLPPAACRLPPGALAGAGVFADSALPGGVWLPPARAGAEHTPAQEGPDAVAERRRRPRV